MDQFHLIIAHPSLPIFQSCHIFYQSTGSLSHLRLITDFVTLIVHYNELFLISLMFNIQGAAKSTPAQKSRLFKNVCAKFWSFI